MTHADWRPTATRDALVARAALVAQIRDFMRERGVLEIETPALSTAAAADPQLASLAVDAPSAPGDRRRFLHTSPEFPLKRLLAAGYGDCYALCKVWRAGEAGRRHNPEFTMLEWYRVGRDHHALMDEVAGLLRRLLGARAAGEPEFLTYRAAFMHHARLDPFAADDAALAAAVSAHGGEPAALDRDARLDLVASHAVYPALGRGRVSFVHDFPASQAALARVRDGTPPVAERFEAFVDGLELANGYHELADAAEQRARFARDNATRRARGLPEMPVDQRLLAALAAGLPDCAGVALGVDRLVMLAQGARSIDEVIAFPWDRA